MGMANCERCGKLFVFLSIKLCPECRELEDRLLRKAREILMKEPHLTVLELAGRLEEPVETIEKFLRERRLTLKKKDGVNLTCEICGKPISEGRRCQPCELRMGRIAREIAEEKRKESRNRMHSLSTIKSMGGGEEEERGTA